jgi:GST-like protein
LALCGQEYELRRAATWRHEGRAQQAALTELTAANPLHQLPTLVLADGTVLSESAAILIHLGLVHPRSGLLPRSVPQRALAMRGLVFVAANLYSAIGVIDHPERWIANEAAAMKLRHGARARLHAMWSVFADVFHPDPATPWLLQAARSRVAAPPGALDLLAAVVSRWSGARAHLERERPALHALLERVDAHPAVAPIFARHWPVRSGF